MRRRLLALVFALAALPAAGCAGAAQSQRPPELEAAYQRMEREPNRSEPYLELARIYFRRGDYLRARQYLTLAEGHPIKDQDGAFRLAVMISVRAGQFDEAIGRCRRQLEAREDAHVRLLLASIFEATGRWSDAELERKLVLSAWPDDPHQIIEMARFYQRSTRPDSAERAAELYRRYLASMPAGPDAPQARAALQAISFNESASRRSE
jgi:tetratricopeptide (TPR) repeat protein